MDVKARVAAKLALELFDESVIDFDGIEPICPFEKMPRQRSASWTDFNDLGNMIAAGRICNSAQNRITNKKMLAQFTRHETAEKEPEA